MWVPTFTLVPIIHLIFGLFPLTFNVWVAAMMLAHYASRAALLHTCSSLKQLRALWLSRVAVAIFWWADLKAATLTPAKALLGPRASFRSRGWSPAVPVRNLKALALPAATVAVSLTALVGGALLLRTTINLPTALSLCCLIINVAPPALLLLYWLFGAGALLARACTAAMLLSWAAGAAALAALALLYPRNVDFAAAAEASLAFLDAQRSGTLPRSYPVPWRADSGEQNVAVLTFLNETTGQSAPYRADLTGGFYNDGEVGPVKVTWNIALTTAMLAWSLLEYEDFWGASEARKNHALALLTHGLAYVEATYIPTPLVDPFGHKGLSSQDKLVYAVRFLPHALQCKSTLPGIIEFCCQKLHQRPCAAVVARDSILVRGRKRDAAALSRLANLRRPAHIKSCASQM